MGVGAGRPDDPGRDPASGLHPHLPAPDRRRRGPRARPDLQGGHRDRVGPRAGLRPRGRFRPGRHGTGVRGDPADRAERVHRRPDRGVRGAGRGRRPDPPEYAPGQFEIAVGALDPVAAADRSVLVRQTVRAVARRHGLRVSFSPAVAARGVGNGGHIHLSAWRDGANLHAGGDRRYGLTADAEAFAAGVLAHLTALTAVTAPSPASYLRLRPSQWAGVTAWGLETRESAVRLVRGTAGRRAERANLEVKPVDLAADPYLALGCLIAAGLDGLASGATLPEETTGDPARLDAGQAAARDVRRLPTSLGEALTEFRGTRCCGPRWARSSPTR
ncbi:hypothetical protein ACIBBD_10945 [Streptomyces sp. NPDC051315]|uniref:hypothetical protein n=1 Tax=Streptomyces sp. NPDC051315 TaxID=3365650 RepID=UPI0037AC9D86